MLLTGAEILVNSLIDNGVDTVFGYPGGAVLNIYDALFKKSDMELWIKHSFWGDSDNYWGEAEDAYNWSESRPKDFKLDTFDKSKELVSNKNIIRDKSNDQITKTLYAEKTNISPPQ